jgi:chromosome segregation protein
MYFKTLEIQGFKSFADKTILTFDNRTTAVVGSNGNGKSNISDALRWVMGEQGAKVLRGTQMEDVIFYGTQSRKPMGFAKVALTIDNRDRRLSVDSDEVVITRKLYRTSDSEYLINGEKSRLKDIHSLFMGTGLGRDGYSIIGQGRIEEIVNSKAAGRRELFEEAAGVSKFLHQKALSERELERAQENLLRLLDIETELQARLPVLEKQAEKAKKAFALKEEERAVGVSLSVRELERISADVQEARNAILQNQGQCEHFDREITELESQTEKINESRREISARRDRLQRQGDVNKTEIAEADKAIAVAQNEIIHNNGRVSAITEQIKLCEKSTEEILAQIKELSCQAEHHRREITEIESQTQNCQSSITDCQLSADSLDQETAALSSEIGELYTSKSAAEIYISRARETIGDLTAQLDQAQAIIAGQADEKQELESKLTGLKNELDGLTTEKEETSNKLSGYSRLYESKAGKRDEARENLEKIKHKHYQKKTRFDVLSNVERSMEGYFGSVKSVIQAAKSGRFGRGTATDSSVHGIVADIINVDKQYSIAVETALGSALQNIIVDNESTAKRCMSFLKENKGGRATFLPLTSIKGGVLENSGLYTQDGFIGLGHEIVGHDLQYSGIIKWLLGRTAFAEDIDCAAIIAKKYAYKFRVVTLDGQVINTGGSFTGGSVKKTEGIISRKQELTELQKSLESLTAEIEPAKSRHDMLAAECAKMKLECEGMSENLVRFSVEETRLTAEIDGVRGLLDSFEEQLENSRTTLGRCKLKITEEQDLIGSHSADLARITAELTEKEQIACEKGNLLQNIVNRRRQITETISELNMQKLTKTKDIENLNGRIDSLNKTRSQTGEDRDTLTGEIAVLNQNSSEFELFILDKQQEIEQINQKLTESKQEITQLIKTGEEYEKRVGEINTEIREKISHKEKFSNAHAAAIERQCGLERKSAEIIEALWNDYELTPSEAAQFVGCDDSGVPCPQSRAQWIKETRTRLNEIKRKLAALGTVNYEAVAELSEVCERYKLLSEQLSDVRKAKSELEKLITELTVDIRARFLESFNDINRHFSRIFTEIFAGGTARLELDSDDVLECGVEIYAAPPGKLIKSLMALSGGEKALVAITLYFAILLHRPTPFCMLDEVDAALDEVNVVKYINYLKRYSDSTQLMMITHRRSTIEGCDVLYGVFMQEKGVSRLLKQELTATEQ